MVLLPRLSLLALLLLSFSCPGQQHIVRGYYIEHLTYKTAADTVPFELYPDGRNRMWSNDGNLFYDICKDSAGKEPDYFLQVCPKLWNGDRDSFKTVYISKGKNLFKAIYLEKNAFRESGGCFRYDNIHSGVWYQSNVSYCTLDRNGNAVKTITCDDRGTRPDTSISINKYLYDNANRIVQIENFRHDSLYSLIRHIYEPGYQKTETYSSGNSLRERKESFFQKGMLVKEISWYAFGNYAHTNIYTYDTAGRKSRMQTYFTGDNRKDDLIKTRDYYYIP